MPVQSRGTSVSLQIKERKDVAQGIIFIMHLHPVMDKGKTSECTVQSRGTSVNLQIKERKDVCTRKYYHNTLTHCEGQRRNESVPVQSRGTSVSLQIKERKDVAQGIIFIMHSHSVMDKGEMSVCTVFKAEKS